MTGSLQNRNGADVKVENIKVAAGKRLAEALLLDGSDGSGRNVVIELAAGVVADLTLLCTGGRHSIEVDLTGPDTEFNLHGLYIAAGTEMASEVEVGEAIGAEAAVEPVSTTDRADGIKVMPVDVDISVRVNHLAPDCRSRQSIKGIAAGSATGSFTGMIYVAREAQRTDAALHNRNLQLSDTARVKTRPQLEIYADDVKCGHGATVGQLDEEAIYYMRQRGVGEREARRMQLQGFVDDIINRCPTVDSQELFAAKAAELIERF